MKREAKILRGYYSNMEVIMVKAGLRNGYMLLLFVFFSFVVNEIIIIGNDFIAEATDLMLSGQPCLFKKYFRKALQRYRTERRAHIPRKTFAETSLFLL